MFSFSVAQACGSDDNARQAYAGNAGAGGDAQAGASPSAGENSTSGEATALGGSGAGGTAEAGATAGEAPTPGSGGNAEAFVPGAPRLSLGTSHSCALKLDGSVVCWGRGDHGELGDGAFRDLAPHGSADSVAVSELDKVASLAAGGFHNCALHSAALGLECWGGGFEGQLGDDSFHTQDAGGSAKAQPVVLENVKQVAAAGNHTCVLLGDTSALCWGDNGFGQLGDGTQTHSALALPVKGLSGATQVVTGAFHSCALLDDHSVTCWGSGGLDGGSPRYLLAPTPIEGVSDATALVAGIDFTCALVADGAVQCWGEGDLGQLGDGKENDSYQAPVLVKGLSGVVQLSAGGRHVCALDRDRSLVCWGDGEFGQLGDGVFHDGFPTDVSTPAPASAFDDVVEVACGGAHTCVLTSANRVRCVGDGRYGQLGDGAFRIDSPFGVTKPVTALDL